MALVDVPVERGCLTFLPGSHHRPGPERMDLSELANAGHAVNDTTESYLYRYWPQLRWNPRITIPVRAGDVRTYQPIAGHNPLPYQHGHRLADDHYPRVTT